jgi:hypothetical protein
MNDDVHERLRLTKKIDTVDKFHHIAALAREPKHL